MEPQIKDGCHELVITSDSVAARTRGATGLGTSACVTGPEQAAGGTDCGGGAGGAAVAFVLNESFGRRPDVPGRLQRADDQGVAQHGPGVDEIKVRETLNGVESDSTAYSTSSVTRIDVFAGYGDDTVIIETDASNPVGTTGIDQPTRLYGDNGDDYLQAGDASDVLYGQIGNDELHGGASDDSLYGGYGGANDADTTGSDILIGDAGSDFLDGGPGTDWRQDDPSDEYINIENTL